MDNGKVIVTGGAGFIGSHVAEDLLKLGYHVVVLDDLSGGFEDNVPRGAKFIKGSILDVDLIKALFEKHNFDYVFHLAAYAAEGLSHFIKRFNYNNNVIGSINLINESVKHDVKCFIFTSSIAVYGTNQLPMCEDLTPDPEDPYGIAKLAVEKDLAATKRMFGLDYVIFRPHNVFGEKQNIGDKYRNVIGIFMNQIIHNHPLPIFGDGNQTRAFSYIGEVSPIIARSIENKECYNQIFNIGADHPYSINELVDIVGNAMGQKPATIHLPPRNEVVHAYADHSKIKQAFNTPESIPIELGIKKMAQWAKQTGIRTSKEFDHIELTKNLPPSWAQANG
ncbi:MAG: NAD-dependent epimerase/dehydratase family protein [Candidatus Binatia bacterium]